MSLRCHFDADGWLAGPIDISHHMTPNRYDSGFVAPARGVVQHTEDGFEAGTFATFMNAAEQVSALGDRSPPRRPRRTGRLDLPGGQEPERPRGRFAGRPGSPGPPAHRRVLAGPLFAPAMASYLNGVFAADSGTVPAGATVYCPKADGSVVQVTSPGDQPLHVLSEAHDTECSSIVRATAEHSPGGKLADRLFYQK